MDIDAIETPDPERPNLPDSEPPDPQPILHTVNYSTIYHPHCSSIVVAIVVVIVQVVVQVIV